MLLVIYTVVGIFIAILWLYCIKGYIGIRNDLIYRGYDLEGLKWYELSVLWMRDDLIRLGYDVKGLNPSEIRKLWRKYVYGKR